MTRGIVYLAINGGILCRLAVSLHTLRRFCDLPVTILADDAAAGLLGSLARDAKADVAPFELPKKRGRNKHYLSKPHVPALSPYDETIQIDADTAFTGRSFDELWPDDETQLVLTQFADWQTTSRRIKRRLGQYASHPMAAEQMSHAWPAVNTGVLAYGRACAVAREQWPELTDALGPRFIVDEMAMQILLPTAENLKFLNDSFNCSPIYGKHQTEAVVWHFHGRKHVRRDQCRAVWMPELEAAMAINYGDIRNLADYDRHLRRHRRSDSEA